MATKNYVQIPTAYLSGSGVVIAATTVTVNSFNDIYGNALTMTDFGDKGYCTVEPDSTNAESFTFTNITTNANGTVTLGGIATSLAKSPYTETSGLVRSHVGGSKVVVTDTVAFFNTFANKVNNETITGLYTFTQNPIGLNPGGITDASTTAIGIARASASPNRTIGTVTITIATPGVLTFATHGLTVNDRIQLTTTGALPTGLSASTTYYVISAGLTANTFQVSATQGGTAINTTGSQSGVHTLIKTTPVAIVDTDTRFAPNNGAVATGSANAFVVTLTPAITAYNKFQVYSFIANFAITGSATVAYNGLAALTFKKLDGATNLISGDIASGMVVQWMYDGTNAVILNPVANNSFTFTDMHGNGIDGDVVISGNTSLTRDMYYNNLTINNTFTLSPKGFRIFVKGVLTCVGTGKIDSNGGAGGVGGVGNTASPASGGTAGAQDYTTGTLPIPKAGLVGASASATLATNGSNGNAVTINLTGNAAAAGGNGAVGTGGLAGGTGGTAGATGTQPVARPYAYTPSYNLYDLIGGTLTRHEIAPTGGSGGSGSGANPVPNYGAGGGGSGSTGGVIWISAKTISTLNVNAVGGAGGNGGAGAGQGQGGGGSGGSGGAIILIYSSGSGIVTNVAGGTGGTGATVGGNGGNGIVYTILV